jgi:hypothetical protein
MDGINKTSKEKDESKSWILTTFEVFFFGLSRDKVKEETIEVASQQSVLSPSSSSGSSLDKAHSLTPLNGF